ncbi:stomatin-like protein 1 isoform X2 [Littorina saxatilis]
MNSIVFIAFIITFPVSVWFAIKVVPNFERLVVFRWGRLYQTKGPGMVFVMPFVDRCHKVDIRMKAFTVPPQQVITGDGAIIEVGADVYYHIANPEFSITNVQNLDKSTRVLLQTSLLNQLVQLPLSRIESQRNAIAQNVQDTCNKASGAWGIDICRLDISQIKVLQKPPTNQPKPSVVMPPGLAAFGGLGAAAQSLSAGAVPEAFQQLASAFMTSQGFTRETPQPQQTRSLNMITPVTTSYNNASASTLTGASSAAPAAAGDASASAAGSCASASESSPNLPIITEILEAAEVALSEQLVRKVMALYQFQLSGDGGGVYFLDLKHGSGGVGEGVWQGEGEPDATMMMTVQDMHLLLCGKLKPFQAYMSGRLKISGDLSAAMKLEAFIEQVVKHARIIP